MLAQAIVTFANYLSLSDCKINGQTYKRIEKQLLFVRHAEGYHNSLFEERKVHEAINIRDPELTPLGNNQVADLRKEVGTKITFDACQCGCCMLMLLAKP